MEIVEELHLRASITFDINDENLGFRQSEFVVISRQIQDWKLLSKLILSS
jgi:hypothetical protein